MTLRSARVTTFRIRPYTNALCAVLCAAATLPCFGGAALAQAGSITAAEAPEPIPWANPYQGDSIRVLVIAPRFTLVDATEFARHVECQVSVAPLWSRTELGGPIHHGSAIPQSSESESLAMLRDRLSRKYDLIVAANFEFRILPNDVVLALADQVGGGTGLLLANIDPTVDPRWSGGMTPLDDVDAVARVTRGIGEHQTPAWATGLDFVFLATLGRGHIAWLDYPGGAPATHCLQPLSGHIGFESDFSENYFSLIVRCAHWAAGIESPLHIAAVEEETIATANEESVPTGLILEEAEALQAALHPKSVKRFNVRLSAPAQRKYSVKTRTRRPGDPGHSLLTRFYEDHVGAGDQVFPVYVAAGTGDYFLDVWLLDDGQVVDWFTSAVQVDQYPRIVDVEFEQPWLGRSDTIALNSIVELNPFKPRPCIVRARAFDTEGRRIAESISEVTPGTNRVRHVLEAENVEGPIIRVEIAALDQESVQLPASWEFNVAATHRAVLPVYDDAPFRTYELLNVWSVADQSVSSTAFDALHAIGLDGVYFPAGGSAIYDAAAAGLRPMVGARMFRDIDESGAEQEPLFFNPRIEPLLDIVRDGAPTGAGPFLLQRSIAPAADETENPNYVLAYRNAVQRDYHNIETLNAVWRTDFIDWDHMAQPVRRDVVRTHNLEPWMRYQAAIDVTRSANWGIMASLMRQAFEGARVGFDFTDPFPHESIDWRTTHAVLAPPDPLTVERTRSYLAPDADAYLVYPDLLLEGDSPFGPWLPWYGLFHGFSRGVWPDAVGQADRVPPALLLNAEGAPRATPPRALAEVKRIKSGVGTLLLHAERNNCGIAIYDSRASEHLNDIEASFATQSDDALRSLFALLTALGFQFELIAPADVLNGKLADYRLLVLPMVRALSEDEVRAIRAFHREGGCLIADVACGQFDENGIPRDVLPFDDLFGVRHPRPVQASGPSKTVVELRMDGNRVTAELAGVYTDSSVEPLEADVGGMADHVPTWIVCDKAGERAALLNHAFPMYRIPDGDNERAMRVLMNMLLSDWAGPPPVDVQPAAGFFGETAYWRYGGAQIVTLLAHPLQKRDVAKVRVSFDQSQRVYSRLIPGTSSKKGTIEIELAPGEPAVLVALPYEVRDMELESADSAVPGERLPFQIKLDTGKQDPRSHLIRVELVPPKTSPFGTRVIHLETTNGAATGRIRLALNERHGIYTLRARDLLTGTTAERTVHVGDSGPANQPFVINR